MKNKINMFTRGIICIGILVMAVFISGCKADNTKVIPNNPFDEPEANEIENTESIFFEIDEWIPDAVAREPYSYSFCRLYVDPAVTTPSDICGNSDKQYSPSGGNPPYHFQLESGSGFPPIGVTLHPNGLLEGTPAAAGTFNFTVCAVDQAGTQDCQPASLWVKDIKVTFDSLTCELMSGAFYSSEGPTYKIIAKGTAKGPEGVKFYYKYNIQDITGLGCTSAGAFKKENSCGEWGTPEEFVIYPSCTNDKGIDAATSWTIVYDIWFTWRHGYVEGQSTSFTLKNNAYIEDISMYSNGSFFKTTPVEREVRCS